MYKSPRELTLIDSAPHAACKGTLLPLAADRIARARRAHSTRRVDLNEATALLGAGVRPRAGDLVLARVARIRQHTRLELPTGRRATLYPGDEIVVCYGDRYAPDQFESVVPNDLSPCHLVAAGGIASRHLCKHSRIKSPTEIEPVGILADRSGRAMNVYDWRLAAGGPSSATRPFTLAVVGTSMNAGKTTAAAHLIRGLTASGLQVGAAKITGTGSGGDTWLMKDSGAREVVDFTDAGYASTYRVAAPELEAIFLSLTGHLRDLGAEATVLEVADGLFQDETAAVLESAVFRKGIDGVLFAAADAMGATGGAAWLERRGLALMAVTGALTASPLAAREAQRSVSVPVLTLADLADPAITGRLAGLMEQERAGAATA
ncbi:MAG: hypothetical protein PVF91_10680 [Chromatiales bacterium]|jgi:hypothetical protein